MSILIDNSTLDELVKLQGDGQLSLHQLDQLLDELSGDIRWIKSEFIYLRRERVRARFCLDYDVLFPAAEARKVSFHMHAESSFWSSLVIDLSGIEIILLPGTLSEILHYAEKKLENIKRITSTDLGSAFMQSVSRLEFNNEATENYRKLAKLFRRAHVSEADSYLLRVIQKRAQTLEDPLPEIGSDLLYQCISQLSRGARVNKIFNNRVDAYNYSLVSALNSQSKREFRYLLVSTSRFMARLDDAAWQSEAAYDDYPFARNVITPRRAAIFQLLSAAGEGAVDSAEKTANRLLSSILDAQAKVAGMQAVSGAAAIRGHDVTGFGTDNVFLILISSFVEIAKKVEKALKDKRESIEIASKTYLFRNPVEFFDELKEIVDRILRKTRHKEIPRRPVNLRIDERPKDPRFHYDRHIDFLGPGKEIAFSYFRYSDDHLFLSRDGGVDLANFINLYNHLATQVYTKITARKYEDWGHNRRQSVVVGTANFLEEKPFHEIGNVLTPDSLARLFKVAKDEINFIRIKQSWFDVSFEGNVMVMSTEFPISEEIAMFLEHTTRPKFRTTNYRRVVEPLLSATLPSSS